MLSAVPMPMQRGFALLTILALALGAIVPMVAPSPTRAATSVFINEIHYDNIGTDAGEAIEVVGPAGTDLGGWSIVLYNGSNGAPYGTTAALSGILPDEGNGFGTTVATYPSNGIQNGSPDGLALVNGSDVVQFLSYEGTLAAVGGPADGMTSTDIGISQDGDPVGQSLQLIGTGTTDEAFSWTSQASSFGAVNSGQTFGTVANQPVVANCGEPVSTTFGEEATTIVTASDADGTVTELAIAEVSPPDAGISIGETTVEGGTASAEVTVGAETTAGSYTVEIIATNDDDSPQTGDCTLTVTVMGEGGGGVTGIVISQVYGGGGNSGATYTNDFIELFNRTSAPISVAGWSVQYASSGGTSWGVTALTGTMDAGGYYLVQQAQGAGGTTPLPAPDASGTSTMAAGSGKVALSSGTTPLSGTCPLGGTVVDFVGYGSAANCFEGSGPTAPTLTNPFAAQRDEFGCEDTDDNAADFTNADPAPRNSASPRHSCDGSPVENAPIVVDTTPDNGATNVADDAIITIEFSEAVATADGWYAIDCSLSGAPTGTASGGPTTFTLDVDGLFTSGEVCTVTIEADLVTDVDTDDPPDTMSADHSFSFRAAAICDTAATRIHAIQGSGMSSPIVGQDVVIQAVVVGDYQGADGLSGFFVQEEDGEVDANDETSEGIFVFEGEAAPVEVMAGDVVAVAGTVAEAFGLTQLSNVSVTDCETDATVTPANVSLPVDSLDELEPSEGMLVQLAQELTVTENFFLGQFGEVVLSATGRQFQGTHLAEPGTDAAAINAANLLSRITLDDGSDDSNPDPLIYPAPGLTAANTLRTGATVDGITAVLSYGFGLYRLQPVGEVAFENAADRPISPPDVGGRTRVAAFNVLNYFNGDGAGGGFPTARGALTPGDFQRQHDKIVSAILALDADVVGLMEIENDGGDAIPAVSTLVDGLNAVAGAGTYDFIPTGDIGTDEIAVAIIYQPAAVIPVDDHAILDSSVDPDFNDQRNRPVLAQTFAETGTGSTFTVAVNHLKSKGSPCGTPDDQPDSGGGNCNGTRTSAAEALVEWLAADPTGSGDPDAMIIGDLNSYAKEDPIDAIRAGGYTDLLATPEGGAYTYVFGGASGYLDHALSSESLTAQVTAAAPWHINADEPRALEYSTEFSSDSQDVLFYAPDAYRSSDHDPVLIGLDLDAPPVITSLEVTEVSSVDEEVTLSAAFTDPNEDETHTATIDWGDGETETIDAGPGTVDATHAYGSAGIYTVTLTVTDSTGLSDTESVRYAVVYDPAAGFVTGGGSIVTDAGTASFGISLSYKRSGRVPEGDFSFELPDLAFEATGYEWLVVDGSRAWVSGEGTVNGEAGHRFLLAVTDEPDQLRLKIWDAGTGDVVFDNQPDDPDDADATEPIRGGQIKVHEGRGPGAGGGGPRPR